MSIGSRAGTPRKSERGTWLRFFVMALIGIAGVAVGYVARGNFSVNVGPASNSNGATVTVTRASIPAASTVTLTRTSTEVITTTMTVTPPLPTQYQIQGTITVTYGTTPTIIHFASPGYSTLNFTVSGNTYQATLYNSLQYTVSVGWHYNDDPLARTFNSGCGTFKQTVGPNSSILTMNWNC